MVCEQRPASNFYSPFLHQISVCGSHEASAGLFGCSGMRSMVEYSSRQPLPRC